MTRPRTAGIAHRRSRESPARSRALSLVVLSDGTPAGMMEVVEAELVEAEQPGVASDMAESLLDAFLTEDGRLVPARTAAAFAGALGDPRALRRMERAHRLDELAAAALAPETLRGYGGHVKAWKAWARAEGVPALPLNPRFVADFILDYALEWDWDAGEFARDEEGRLQSRVSASSMALRLQALNKLSEFIGMPRPGDNPGIKQLMAGLRRSFGVRSEGKAALDLALVTRLLAAAAGETFTDARDRAARLLRARTGASAGQLARLTWAAIDPAADGSSVTITLARTHRHGQPAIVRVPAHPNEGLCLVQALARLLTLSPRVREVLTHRDGQRLSRQALHLAMADGWEALPGLDDRALASLLADRCPATPASALRNCALLLVGFYTALRRSNLAALNWRDVTDHGEDGFALLIRRSKTDQEGRGRISWVPQASPDARIACPARALRAWKAELERALGRPVKGAEPVFVALTSSGSIKATASKRPVRLSGDAINEAVQRLTIAAGVAPAPKPGVANPFGAHSLRSGFVTEAVRGDKLSIVEIMEVTGHTSSEMVVRYRREANAAKRNASRKLIGILASS